MHLAMGVPLRVATATSNLMIGITAAASAVIYLLRGGIDPYVAGPTAIGVFLGATARLAARPPGRRCATCGCCSWSSCVYTAIQMLLRAVTAHRADRRRRTRGAAAAERRSAGCSSSVTYVVGRAARRSASLLMIADGHLAAGRRPAARPRDARRRARSPSSPAGFLWLGLLAVIATPIGRVIVAAVGLRPGRRTGDGRRSRSRSSPSSPSASVSASTVTV